MPDVRDIGIARRRRGRANTQRHGSRTLDKGRRRATSVAMCSRSPRGIPRVTALVPYPTGGGSAFGRSRTLQLGFRLSYSRLKWHGDMTHVESAAVHPRRITLFTPAHGSASPRRRAERRESEGRRGLRRRSSRGAEFPVELPSQD
jgi:hypothetical protein